MKLIIDTREPILYDKCVNSFSQPSVELSMASLNLGDISLQTNDGEELCIIERKSLADLLASIKDGRYDEQSHRLIHSSNLHSHNILYIIEGMFSQLRSEQERKLVCSTITSLSLFKGFSVIRTCSVNETAEFIMYLADKAERNLKAGKKMAFTGGFAAPPPKAAEETSLETVVLPQITLQPLAPPSVANYTSVVKKVKKENVTAENIAEIILCQIPGVSSITASQIMAHFTGLWDLVNSAKNNPERFASIYLETNGKKRKLNKNVIAFLQEISV